MIKGSRFLLVAGCENIDSTGYARLAELTGLNVKISTAYILKEEFRHIYAVATSARFGAVRIRRWCGLAEESAMRIRKPSFSHSSTRSSTASVEEAGS